MNFDTKEGSCITFFWTALILILIIGLSIVTTHYNESRFQKELEQTIEWANQQKTAKMIGVYAVYDKTGIPKHYVKVFETKDGTRLEIITDKLPVIGEVYEIIVTRNRNNIDINIGAKID